MLVLSYWIIYIMTYIVVFDGIAVDYMQTKYTRCSLVLFYDRYGLADITGDWVNDSLQHE